MSGNFCQFSSSYIQRNLISNLVDNVPVLGSPAPSKTNFSPDILMFVAGRFRLIMFAVLCTQCPPGLFVISDIKIPYLPHIIQLNRQLYFY